jgi:hypothetical protein
MRASHSSRRWAEEVVSRVEASVDLSQLTEQQAARLLDDMDRWIDNECWRVATRKKLQFIIDLSKPSPVIVDDILREASEKNVGGPVCHHLVGAVLARRFPQMIIDNYAATVHDEHLNREADFLIQDAALHVTVVPTSDHLQRCAENVLQGRQPYLIVPAAQIVKARALAEDKKLEEKVAIISIETFVGQNIAEMGEFNRDKIRPVVAAVLKEYNRRVAAVETDQSIQINIPKQLAGAIK